MKKSYAFLISTLITLFVFFSINSLSFDKKELSEGVVQRVIDGDTIRLNDGVTIRLANINSPEKGDYGYKESHDFLLNFVNKTIYFEVVAVDNNDRLVARIYENNKYLNLDLVKRGISFKAWVQNTELKEFSSSERFAIENELGIWKKSKYYGCLNLTVEPKEERINVKINCINLFVRNWTIRDESREKLVFSVNLTTFNISQNNDSSKDIFWSDKNILNNDRDTIYIFDANNSLIFFKQYGYD